MPKPPKSEGLRIGKLRPKNKDGKQAVICPACLMPYSTHGAGGNCLPQRDRTVQNDRAMTMAKAAMRDGIMRIV